MAKHSSIDPSARGPCPQIPQRHPGVAKGVFWPVFGTAPLPTGTPVASPRGEGKEIGTVDVIMVGFATGFGTATLPTDASVASSRSHCELVYRIVAILGFVKFTWHEPLLIIK